MSLNDAVEELLGNYEVGDTPSLAEIEDYASGLSGKYSIAIKEITDCFLSLPYVRPEYDAEEGDRFLHLKGETSRDYVTILPH